MAKARKVKLGLTHQNHKNRVKTKKQLKENHRILKDLQYEK